MGFILILTRDGTSTLGIFSSDSGNRGRNLIAHIGMLTGMKKENVKVSYEKSGTNKAIVIKDNDDISQLFGDYVQLQNF